MSKEDSEDDRHSKTLQELDAHLRKSRNKGSQEFQYYEEIIEVSKTSLKTLLKTKELGARLIPFHLNSFPSLATKAFEAYANIINDLSGKVRVEAISQLPMFYKDTSEFTSKIIDLLVKCLNTDKLVELEAVHEAFMSLLRQDTKASLTALFKHTEATPTTDKNRPRVLQFIRDKVFPLKEELLKPQEEMERHITDLIKKSLGINVSEEEEFNMFIGFLKSLSIFGAKAPQERMQEPVEIVERQANLDARLTVRDRALIGRAISYVETALPFFVNGAQDFKFLNYLREKIMPYFDMLLEDTKVRFLRVLAELSPHTTAEAAGQMLPSIVRLLKRNVPSMEISVEINFTDVECLLYMFHHLAHKAPDATESLCGYKIVTGQLSGIPGDEVYKDFTTRLTKVQDTTQAKMNNLARKMIVHDNSIRCLSIQSAANETLNAPTRNILISQENVKRQCTKAEIRTCLNISAMTEALQAETPFFIGDTSVNLSWKEERIPLPLKIDRRKREHAPSRDKLPEHYKESLSKVGMCKLRKDKDVNLFVDLSQNSTLEGPFILKDDNYVTMLCCKKKNSELSRFESELISWNHLFGYIRDQQFHLLCWAYTTSDIVSAGRVIHNWEKEYIALCPWYLCAFVDPESLGMDPRAMDGHHCYGCSNENSLLFIQKRGIPREVVEEFDCKDYVPPTVDEPFMNTRNLKAVRKIETLEEVLEELQYQPISADLIHCRGMMETGKQEIYYGPMSEDFHFLGYHSVIISGTAIIGDELVAVCRSSHGENPNNKGYINVSLATLYMPVGVFGRRRGLVRSSSKFVHLLSNFLVIEMDVKGDEKKDKERNEKKDKERNEKNDEDSEEEKYKHKPKRYRRSGGLYIKTTSNVQDGSGVSSAFDDNNYKNQTRSRAKKGENEFTWCGSEDAKTEKPKVYADECTTFLSDLSVKIGSNQQLVNDLEAAKLIISQLEAVLEASIKKVDAKTYLKECEKLIQDAKTQIHDLHSASYSVEIGSNQQLVNDLDAAKLRISQLEAVLEATIEKVDAKSLCLKEGEKLIQDAESQIHDLQSASYNFEGENTFAVPRNVQLLGNMTA